MSVTWAGQSVTISTGSTGNPIGPASGDLAGSYPGPTVDGLQGRPVSATAPTTGQAIVWSGTEWAPANVGGSLADADYGDITVSSSGTVWTIDSSAVTTTKLDNNAVTTAKIGNHEVTYQKIEQCTAHHLLGRGSGNGTVQEIPATSFAQTLLDDADAATARTTLGISTAGGDLTGSYPNPTIASIGGVTLAGQPAGRIFRANGSGGLIATRLFDPATTAVAFTECTTSSFNDYQAFQSGAGAGTSAGGNADTPRVGIAISDTGTTATGRAAICTATTFTWAVGTAALYYETALYLDDLSDGTDTFHVTAGFFDILTASTGDRICFEYTDTVGTGAQWDCVTQASGGGGTTRTSVGSNVVLNQWYKLAIEINAAGTSVAFYIDGTLVATHTTTIPTGAQRMGSGYNLRKTVGTAQCDVWCDYILTQQEVTR